MSESDVPIIQYARAIFVLVDVYFIEHRYQPFPTLTIAPTHALDSENVPFVRLKFAYCTHTEPLVSNCIKLRFQAFAYMLEIYVFHCRFDIDAHVLIPCCVRAADSTIFDTLPVIHAGQVIVSKDTLEFIFVQAAFVKSWLYHNIFCTLLAPRKRASPEFTVRTTHS